MATRDNASPTADMSVDLDALDADFAKVDEEDFDESHGSHHVELKPLFIGKCISHPVGCCCCCLLTLAYIMGCALFLFLNLTICISFNFSDFKVLNSEISNNFYKLSIASETSFDKIYYATNDDSNNRRRLGSLDASDYSNRANAAIYLSVYYYSAKTQNILTEDLLNTVSEIEKGIKDWSGYHDHSLVWKCSTKTTPACNPSRYFEAVPGSLITYMYPQVINGSYVYNGNGDDICCVVKTFLREYVNIDGSSASNDDGVSISSDMFDFGFDLANVSSKYLASVYPFGYKSDEESKEDLQDWILTFKDYFQDVLKDKKYKDIGLAYADSSNVILQDELFYYLGQDLNLAFYSVLVIFVVVYCFVRSVFITLFGIIGVLMSFIPCFAVYNLIYGDSFNIVNLVSIWVILGIGCDDICVFISSFRRAPLESVNGDIIPNHLRMAFAYREAGFAMFVTSFTTAFSFYSLCISTINPLPQFGFFLGSLVICNFILVMTWFPCILQAYVWMVWIGMKCHCFCNCCARWLAVPVAKLDHVKHGHEHGMTMDHFKKNESVKFVARHKSVKTQTSMPGLGGRSISTKFVGSGGSMSPRHSTQLNSKHPGSLVKQLSRKLESNHSLDNMDDTDDNGGGFEAETHLGDCTVLYFTIMRRGLGIFLIVVIGALTIYFAYEATTVSTPSQAASLLPAYTNWGRVNTAIEKLDVDVDQYAGFKSKSNGGTGSGAAVISNTPKPTRSPVVPTTASPTRAPVPPTTADPTNTPTTAVPTANPITPTAPTTAAPTTDAPTLAPTTPAPTDNPTSPLTPSPTTPSTDPTTHPTKVPTQLPTSVPTGDPTKDPTNDPTGVTASPSDDPTNNPTKVPTPMPTTKDPTPSPESQEPTPMPTPVTPSPTTDPTVVPTTMAPTDEPTNDPTIDPTDEPTNDPTQVPTSIPTDIPTEMPTDPTTDPTLEPSVPTTDPTYVPTDDPTDRPSEEPSEDPTTDPTMDPTVPSKEPTSDPTKDPTAQPTSDPTLEPTLRPTFAKVDPQDSVFKCTQQEDYFGLNLEEGTTFTCNVALKKNETSATFVYANQMAVVLNGGGLNDIGGCTSFNTDSSFYDADTVNYTFFDKSDRTKWCYINDKYWSDYNDTGVSNYTFEFDAPYSVPSPSWLAASLWVVDRNGSWVNVGGNVVNFTIVENHESDGDATLSVDESLYVYLLFGVGDVTDYTTDCDGEVTSGDVTYDKNFDIYTAHSQQRAVDLCNELEELGKSDNVMYRDDADQKPCMWRRFENYINWTNGTWPMDDQEEFNSEIRFWLDNDDRYDRDLNSSDFADWIGIEDSIYSTESNWTAGDTKITWFYQACTTQINKNWGASLVFEYYEKWEKFINAFNKDSKKEFQGIQTSPNYIRMEVELAFLTGFVQSVLYTILLCAIVMIFFTQNLALVVLVSLYIIIICIWIVGIFGALNWEFGIIEVISVPTVVGLTIDYALHITHAYIHSPFGDRVNRAKSAVNDLGGSVMASALTTISAMIILYYATIVIFSDLGWVVGATTSFAVCLAVFVCPPFLMYVGPERDVCSLSWFFKLCGIRLPFLKHNTWDDPHQGTDMDNDDDGRKDDAKDSNKQLEMMEIGLEVANASDAKANDGGMDGGVAGNEGEGEGGNNNNNETVNGGNMNMNDDNDSEAHSENGAGFVLPAQASLNMAANINDFDDVEDVGSHTPLIVINDGDDRGFDLITPDQSGNVEVKDNDVGSIDDEPKNDDVIADANADAGTDDDSDDDSDDDLNFGLILSDDDAQENQVENENEKEKENDNDNGNDNDEANSDNDSNHDGDNVAIAGDNEDHDDGDGDGDDGGDADEEVPMELEQSISLDDT